MPLLRTGTSIAIVAPALNANYYTRNSKLNKAEMDSLLTYAENLFGFLLSHRNSNPLLFRTHMNNTVLWTVPGVCAHLTTHRTTLVMNEGTLERRNFDDLDLHGLLCLLPSPAAAYDSPSTSMISAALGTVIAAVLALLVVLHRCGLFGGSTAPRRTAVLLMGLPSSGKTCLFAQLTRGEEVQTCTSMELNEGTVTVGGAAGGSQKVVHLIDHPGHRRLYPSLLNALQRAIKVVIVVDAVTIHDDRHEGAAAVAELLHRFIQTPEFYGVREVLVACTKRDEITSFSSTAVKKLLEAAMATCIQSRRGELSHVDEVLDAKGVVVGKRGAATGHSSGGRHFQLEMGEHNNFAFDQHMPIPVRFVDVSSFPQSQPSNFNTAPFAKEVGVRGVEGRRRERKRCGEARQTNRIQMRGSSLMHPNKLSTIQYSPPSKKKRHFLWYTSEMFDVFFFLYFSLLVYLLFVFHSFTQPIRYMMLSFTTNEKSYRIERFTSSRYCRAYGELKQQKRELSPSEEKEGEMPPPPNRAAAKANMMMSKTSSREDAQRRLNVHRNVIETGIQVLDGGVNCAPEPLQQRQHGGGGGLLGRGALKGDDISSSLFQSSILNSFSESKTGSRRGMSMSSRRNSSSINSMTSMSLAAIESTANSFPGSSHTGDASSTKEAAQQQSMLDQAACPRPKQLTDTEYRQWLRSKTTITLKETPTIFLFSHQDESVSNENQQEIEAVNARHEQLERLQEMHRLDEGTKFQSKGTITFIPPKKSIHSEVHPPLKINADPLQVTTWMLKDEFAPLLEGEDDYDDGLEDEEDDNELEQDLDDESTAERTPSLQDDQLGQSGGLAVEDKTNKRWIFAESLMSNLRIMERAVVQNYMEHLQLQYRGIAMDPSCYRHEAEAAAPEPAKPPTPERDTTNLWPTSDIGHDETPKLPEEAAASPQQPVVEESKRDLPDVEMSPDIEILWRYHSPMTQGRSVTCMTWNRKVTDILAVGYSVKQTNPLNDLDENDADRRGLVCCWSLKNPLAPELTLSLNCDASVSSVAFSFEHPSLLAVGNTDGGIVVYDIQKDLAAPSICPAVSTGQHTGAVWDLKWVARGKERGEFLMSVSADGRVVQWAVGKSIEKVAPDLMHLTRQPGQQTETIFVDGVAQADEAAGRRRRHNKEAVLSRQCGGMCFDICPTDSAIYVVGTEDGSVYQCNKSQTESYDLDYMPHAELVYRIRWSPYSPRFFLTCSADWTTRLYRLDQSKPVIRFDSPNQDAVQDVAWSYTNALTFATVTAQGNVEMWSIMDTIYPRWTIQFRDHRRLNCVLFAEQETPVVIVGDEEGDVSVFVLSGHAFTRQELSDDEQEQWLDEAIRKQQS
eukprot:gene10570-7340_t